MPRPAERDVSPSEWIQWLATGCTPGKIAIHQLRRGWLGPFRHRNLKLEVASSPSRNKLRQFWCGSSRFRHRELFFFLPFSKLWGSLREPLTPALGRRDLRQPIQPARRLPAACFVPPTQTGLIDAVRFSFCLCFCASLTPDGRPGC